MPWYEPSSSAPRYRPPRQNNGTVSGEDWRNNNGQRQTSSNDAEQNDTNIISLQDYLDVHWLSTTNSNNDDDENPNVNNDSSSSSATMLQPSRINFDSFQYRVEHQLGTAIFPTVASSSNSSSFVPNSLLYQTNNNFNYYSNSNSSNYHHHGSNSNSNTNVNNGKSDSSGRNSMATTTSVSKTAQFFHPRKVMALRQYEGFFSPLVDANTEYCSKDLPPGSEEGIIMDSTSQKRISEECNENANSNHEATTNELDLSSSSSRNHHPLPMNESFFHPTIQIQPRNLFDKKDKLLLLPSIQTTLRQDPTTGQLLATSLLRGGGDSNDDGSNKLMVGGGKTSSWENYGGRPLMDEDAFNGQSSLREGGEQNESRNNNKKAKKKKKKDKSKDGGGEKNEQRIDSIFQRTGDDDHNDGGGEAKKKRSSKTKKKRSLIDASCELTVPTADQVDNDNNNNMADKLSTISTKPKLTEQDFEGMTNTMNAAQCMEGLQQFLSRVGQETFVAWTMIFLDPLCHYRQYATDSSSSNGINNNKRRKRSKKFSLNSDTEATMLECTTPFLPSNKRYCTEKGPTCTAWNCTCDDQIRAMRGGAPLLGAMFVLNKRDEEGRVEIGSAATAAEGGRGEKECYLLPLGPTEKCLVDLEAGYSRMKSWPIIPFDCEVSLSDRWR